MKLMESKWFTGMPEDFDTDWCTVVCPVGQRCLVMAIDGETKSFNKKGFRLPGYFLSILPGGNGTEYGFGPTVVTLLDCIYYEEMMTYFILDCIMWASNDVKQYPYVDRMKFVRREIMKRADYKNITNLNMFKFVPLYQFDCTLQGLDQALRQSTFEVDGILFYKKNILYQSGETNEILWTKPYILPDVFHGIAVPKRHMTQKPDNYNGFENFVDDVNNGRIKSTRNKKKKHGKEFIPTVEIKLPPPQECANKGGKKKKQQKQPPSDSNMPRGYGRGMITGQDGWGSGRVGSCMGGQTDGYGRMNAGGDAKHAIYGKGTVSGHSYFGDERDYYYGDGGYGSDYRNRREHTNKHDPYRMSDMQTAVSYNYDYDDGSKSNRGRHYELF